MQNTDNIEERGFINKSKLLEYVTEEDIFELVFGFKPVEFVYVTSPFRVDENPGCWFERNLSTGILRFVDFGNSNVVNGVNMINIDCFDAVSIYFGFSNFYKTLEFIKSKLIDGKNLTAIPTVKMSKVKVKNRVQTSIDIQTRDFNNKDKRYWTKFGITKQQLINDKVFPVLRLKVKSVKADYIKRVNELCYAFTAFDNNRKKLYKPFQKGKKRFLTNCKIDDIGEIQSLPDIGTQLIISKSYKDCRVLRNEGLNSVWFQNEGMIPSDEVLYDLIERFDEIIVFYDNDDTGIEASKKVSDKINSFLPGKARELYLPIELRKFFIKDPADMYSKMGKKHLTNFIKQNL